MPAKYNCEMPELPTYKVVCFYGSHTFPCQSLLLSTTVLNDTCIYTQVRLVLELEETMSALRYYTKTTERLFTQKRTWYDFILGTTKLERREAQLREWEQSEIFQQLENSLVSNNYVTI